jgi:hypothetical protein
VLTKAVLGAVNWMSVWYRPGHGLEPAERDRIADEVADFALAGLVVA